jgi:hypothetical protein
VLGWPPPSGGGYPEALVYYRSLTLSAVGILGAVLVVGAFAGGCGSDEEPSGEAGAAGDSGTDASHETGTGGSSASDAGGDVDKRAICIAGNEAMDAKGCLEDCACDKCAVETFNCFFAGDDVSKACSALVACGREKMCGSLAECAAPCSEVIKNNFIGAGAAAKLAKCVEQCGACAGDGGETEAGPDVTSDGGGPDAVTTDVTTTDVITTEASTGDATTDVQSDAATSDGSTDGATE